MNLVKHRRQYLLTNNHLLSISGFEKIPLSGELVVLVHPDLHKEKIIISNRECLILGTYINCKNNFNVEFSNGIDNELLKESYYYTGRWTIISSEFVFSDASSLGGVYYCNDNSGKYFAVSSSIALIKEHFIQKEVAKDPRSFEWGKGRGYICWYIPPYTKYEKIKRLLPSQLLKIPKLNVIYLDRYKFKMFQNLGFDEKIRITAETIKTVFKNLPEKFTKISIALTSGNDSRLSLAGALASSLTISSFIFNHKNITRSDKKIPFKLAEFFGFSHQFIFEKGNNLNDQKLFFEHSANSAHDGDQYFFLHNQYQSLPLIVNDCIIRTGISPILKLKYQKKFPENKTWSELNAVEILKTFKVFDYSTWTENALKEWIEWNKINNCPLDWRDAFLLEQREGGWMGPNEQSLDILPYETFQPFNSQLIIDLFLSFGDQRGLKNKRNNIFLIFESLFKYLAPELNNFNSNSTDYIKKSKLKFRSLLRRVGIRFKE